MALGDILRIDDRTVVVTGQELDVPHDQPDVANTLIHRVGQTVFVVDTGVTEAFRTALRLAVDQVGTWNHLVVLTTHGHVDHIGNNDLADDLARERGVTAEHYIPARDIPQMTDPQRYWIRSFSRIAGVVPLPAPPALAGDKVVSLFQPLRPFATTTRSYEELPLERITIGSVRASGWTFADGAVQVLRSQGHCAGHVIVRLRDNRVLHLSDEANGPCGVMDDADQLKIQHTLGAVLTMTDEDTVDIVTDGHTFSIRSAAEAAHHLDTLLDQAMRLQHAALPLTERPVTPRDFTTGYARAARSLAVGGANPNEMFNGMMAVNQLRELGLHPRTAKLNPRWARLPLTPPHTSMGMPRGLALVPAALAMVRWKLQRNDR